RAVFLNQLCRADPTATFAFDGDITLFIAHDVLLPCACFLLIVSDVTLTVVLLILSGRGVLRAMGIVGLFGCVILTVRPVSMIRFMVHPIFMPDFVTQIVLIDVVRVLDIMGVILNRG